MNNVKENEGRLNTIKTKVFCRDCGQEMKRATAISWYCLECHLIAEMSFREAGKVVSL